MAKEKQIEEVKNLNDFPKTHSLEILVEIENIYTYS